MFAAYNLNSNGLHYQKPTNYHRGASPKGSWPPIGAAWGCWGLFSGPLTRQITPLFKVHTLYRYGGIRVLKGYPEAKKTQQWSSWYTPIDVSIHGGELGVLRGGSLASLRPQNTSKWVVFKEMLCFSSFLCLFWLWRNSTTRNQVIFNWKYLPQIYDPPYGL